MSGAGNERLRVPPRRPRTRVPLLRALSEETDSEPVSELHAAARGYARRGFHVFPLHSPVDGKCSCGRDCPKPAKHPRTLHGFKDATTDLEQIDKWWQRWPDANIGIATEASGLAVLDVDPHHGGDESLYELEREHGEAPETPRAQTGSGGAHVYFSENGDAR